MLFYLRGLISQNTLSTVRNTKLFNFKDKEVFKVPKIIFFKNKIANTNKR